MLKSLLERLVSYISQPLLDEPAAQKALAAHYRQMKATCPEELPSLQDTGFRKYSQFEEDGMLLYIFSVISTTNKICVELCAGDGRENNTTNLIVNHGWWGFLYDGQEKNVQRGRRFFEQHKSTFLHPPSFEHAWITAENVNNLLRGAGLGGEIDLLSLDIDGMDYWIWEAIDIISPRVFLCEIHNPIPRELSLTVPYDPGFVANDPDYQGASLAAMVKLSRKKGYRFIGTHRYGFNAFFIRDDVASGFFPEVQLDQLTVDPFTQGAQAQRWENVRNMLWEEV